jgi:hypothetical protein
MSQNAGARGQHLAATPAAARCTSPHALALWPRRMLAPPMHCGRTAKARAGRISPPTRRAEARVRSSRAGEQRDIRWEYRQVWRPCGRVGRPSPLATSSSSATCSAGSLALRPRQSRRWRQSDCRSIDRFFISRQEKSEAHLSVGPIGGRGGRAECPGQADASLHHPPILGDCREAKYTRIAQFIAVCRRREA